MNNAVGIIPARWGSTRFPGKALHLIAGKPLLQHVWERCRRAKTLERVIVATDDMRIAEAAFDWGAEVALTSKRHVSGTDRVAEVAKAASRVSYIVNVQGDEPLIESHLIDALVRALQDDRKLQMVTAAHPFKDSREVQSPHQVKVVLDAQSYALYFSRSAIPFLREKATRARFLRHQGIYAYRREFLLRYVAWKPTPLERAEALEQLRALENGVRIQVLVTRAGSPGVDTPKDVEMIERRLISKRGSAPVRKRKDAR